MYEQLMERIYKENMDFLAEVRKLPIDQVIGLAYEICYREEFMCMLENCASLDDEEIEKLLKLPKPVEFLYNQWLRTDASICEMLEDVISDYLAEVE